MYWTEFQKLWRLSLPLILAQLAQNTLSFVDTLMAGALGEEALAGIAIGGTAFHFIFFGVSGVLFAINPMVSHAEGAGTPDVVPRIVRQGFWVGVIFFLPVLLTCWNAKPLLRWMGQSDFVVELSGDYLRAIAWGALPAFFSISLRGFLEGTSNTRPILAISVLAVALNVILNDTLMFGRYGLPALGLVGTGIASAIVHTLIFFMMAVYVWLTKRNEYPIFAELHLPHAETMRELFRVGVPICLTVGFEVALFAAAAFVMGVIDPQQLAAHQISIQSASITFMIPLGIGLGTCVRVGYFAGSGDWQGARTAGRVGMLYAISVMSVSAVLYLVFPHLIIACYLRGESVEGQAVVQYAATFLRIAGMFQIVDGLQVVASNALRGLKHTKAAMYLTLISYWLVGAPACCFLAFGLGREGEGLWYGLTVGLAVAALTLTWRFEHAFARGDARETTGEGVART